MICVMPIFIIITDILFNHYVIQLIYYIQSCIPNQVITAVSHESMISG